MKKVALIILDGWGIRSMSEGNAVKNANTPNFNSWLNSYECSILDASGEAVGLMEGQMGNSEVGHLNLGAGYVVLQDIKRIDDSIANGSFFENSSLKSSIKDVKLSNKKLHLIGLLSSGGVHSHMRHLLALLEFSSKEGVVPCLHLITDGRDTPPKSAVGFLGELEKWLKEFPGEIASVGGRYYAMDRDNRWDRTRLAFNTFVGQGENFAESARQAILQSYENNITDEFIKPTIINKKCVVEDGDVVLFYNFRADRMRQIVASYLGKGDTTQGDLKKISNEVISFTEYSDDLETKVVFPPQENEISLAKVLSSNGLSQFHAAETEKYAHVTYFFNGGQEEAFDGEDRLLIPSPKVPTYDKKPEMSAYELTASILSRLNERDYDFMIVNYANPDMVGHTGNLSAAIKAVEAVDDCAGKLVSELLKRDTIALVTADHGNAERMVDLITGEPHTYHTTSPVPFFVISN
ncbi:MAG TPA: 2,3-bisphosphoglycerate-independent phosphoglycerate mutase, partial [Anaerolineales bacterium]|nr:2,3-bisphosphoglycerate-independent phosphoglycerate mutase [Anaerolineales bacterium]